MTRGEIPAPVVGPVQSLRAEWGDYNGHLNMAYYNVLFDDALETPLRLLGLGAERARRDGVSVFTAEAHVHYLRELDVGDSVQVETLYLAHDAKRFHYVQTMRHATGGWIAAVSENLILHVDLATRRVAPFAPDVAGRLDDMAAAHAGQPVPPQVGRVMGLRKPG